MNGSHLRHSLILLLLAGNCCTGVKSPIIENLQDGSVLRVSAALSDVFIQQIIIAPHSKVTINVTDVSSFTSFIIAQIHAYQYHVNLSYDEDIPHVSNRTVSGVNIGLFVKPNSTITHLYLKNGHNRNVEALVVAISYNNEVETSETCREIRSVAGNICRLIDAPVPGGCNMEFDHEIAPYAKVQLQDTMVIVDAQPASMPFSNKSNCNNNPVEHEMYQMYLTAWDFSPESYFQGIIRMLTVDDIMMHGIQVPQLEVSSPMRRIYSAYTGIGSVYATVATYGNRSAAYVPAFSYACSPVKDPDSCDILTDRFPKIVSGLCFITGVISVLLGQKIYVYDQFIGSLFMGTMIGYMIVGTIGYGLLIGLILAVVLCWIPFVSSLNLGFFFTCVLFFSLPDTFSILHIHWVFLFLLLLTLILMSTLFAFTGPIVGSYITGVLYSSFMVALPLDYWIGSSLKYMLINLVRRITIADFSDAIIIQPFQGKDILLICIWVVVALIRLGNCCFSLVTSLYLPL